MSGKLTRLLIGMKEPPDCCKKCKNLDYADEPYSHAYYCIKNIYIPHKKQSCKKQETWKGA